jgi:hypothetical protein
MKVDWDELKRLDTLRKESMEGAGIRRANKIIAADVAFLKLLDASFPAILAEREAVMRGEFICKSCGIRKDSDAIKAGKLDPQF